MKPLLLFAILLVACSSTVAHPPATLRAIYHLPPITALRPSHTALVLVDFQEEFFSGGLPLPDGGPAVERAAELLAWARHAGGHGRPRSQRHACR